MWEERYRSSAGYLFGKEPALFLRDHENLLEPGLSALSVADGEGRNSVFMAQKGLEVTAIEFAPSAVDRARALATEAGVDVDFRQEDILTREWEQNAFDLVVGIFIQFVGPKDREIQFAGMKQATRPGGLVLLHGYRPEQLDYGTGGPPYAENMYTEGLLRDAFSTWEVLTCRGYDREVQEGRGHSGMSALIDLVARKPA
ncbi:SAM-dependent methyltransferase [Lutimaribacter marinistellae]|uniref:SAM-dependent methyltransferase n=1 Tax=Lutimaribacter marinistellae TaxID=1820329 RepID=A0ABV7TKQ4_9RHOB